MDVLTSETCWALNKEIIKQVTSSCSLFYYQDDARSNKHKRSSAFSFNFQYPLFSLRSSSSSLLILLRLPFSPSSIFHPITCFRRQFLRKMWPIQLPFLLFIVCVIFLSPWLYAILRLSHDRSDWFSPFFPSITFKNFPGISDLLNKVSKFQHHTKLYSKSSTLLVSSLKFSTICW